MKLLFSLLTLALPFGNGFVAPALSQREHDVKRNVRGATNHQPVQAREHRSPVADMRWSSLSTDTGDAGDAGDGPLKNIASAYTLAGMASAVAWIAIAYVGLSFHPTASVNADRGFRHNFLTKETGNKIIVRFMFANVISVPCDCDAIIKEFTDGLLPTDTNLQIWVGSWRKGMCWNHAKSTFTVMDTTSGILSI
jgi:hypothetical protein